MSSDMIELENGNIRKVILKQGQGDELPSEGAEVSVHYVGTLLDGSKFDSSRDRNEPFKFKLGQGNVIKGWDKGVATMKLGEVAKFTISPDYAYGAAGSPPKIPANATLEFEIEMISWNDMEDVTEDGQVSKKVLKAGDGWQTPNSGSTCSIRYLLRFPKRGRSVIDEWAREQEVTVSDPDLLQAVEETLKSMKKGEHCLVKIASAYAYGSNGNSALDVPSDQDLEAEIELVDFKNGRDTWEMDIKEKVSWALKLKDLGNTHYKRGSLDRAASKYSEALGLFRHEKFDKLTSDEQETVNSVKLTCESNSAAVCLKKKDFSGAIKHSNGALAVDPRNVKALVRRGQGHAGLYAHLAAIPHSKPLVNRHDNEQALADFKLAVQLDKSCEKEIAPVLAQVKRRMQELRERQRKMFGGFFEKVKMYDSSEQEHKATTDDASSEEEDE